jgi:hypothetical protein
MILNWSLEVKKEWMLNLLFLPTLAKGLLSIKTAKIILIRDKVFYSPISQTKKGYALMPLPGNISSYSLIN